MKLKDILTRIDDLARPRDLSDQQVSLMGGSRDVLRNWRRAHAEGREIHPRIDTLTSIAQGLGVPLSALTGEGAPVPASQTHPSPQGFSDAASPFTLAVHPVSADDPQRAIRAIFGGLAATPATYRVAKAQPAFALEPGDVLVVDLARLPHPGEIALVNRFDEDTADAVTELRRYLPPFLLAGDVSQGGALLQIDAPGVAVRCPVIGCIRGLGG